LWDDSLLYTGPIMKKKTANTIGTLMVAIPAIAAFLGIYGALLYFEPWLFVACLVFGLYLVVAIKLGTR